MSNIISKINKRHIILILLIVIVSLIVIGLYGTFAFNNNSIVDYEQANKVFNLVIDDIDNNHYSTTVSKNDTKDLQIVLSNQESIDLNYVMYYSGILKNSGVDIGEVASSPNKSSGIISKNATYTIHLRIVNHTSTDVTVNIGVAYGYTSGGDLILKEDEYSIDKIFNEYENLDTSGANKPNIVSRMIPVYYDEFSHNWKKADETNQDRTTMWYNYEEKKWANIVLKNDNTIIDLSNHMNNAKNQSASWDKEQGTLTTSGGSYVDCGFRNYYFGSKLSLVLKFKMNSVSTGKFIGNWKEQSGGGIEYSKINGENRLNGNFYFSDSDTPITVKSNVSLEPNTWYTVVLTYDAMEEEQDNFKIYLNGSLTGSTKASGSIMVSEDSIKIGPDCSITVSDALISTSLLTEEEIKKSYSNNIDASLDQNMIMHYNFMDGVDIPNGTVISDSSSDGTLAFFTWIPRYKYRVWNLEKNPSAYSYTSIEGVEYNAYNKGIDIIFESGMNTTGKINCSYKINNQDFGVYLDDESNYSTLSESCNGSNGDYYTHPAFQFDGPKTGFWISKFEISGSLENPTSLPNMVSLNGSIDSEFDSALIITQSALYGISNQKLTSHMLKNTEWGSVAYLSHSIYGLCDGYHCEDIKLNNSTNFYTGRSMGSNPTSTDISSNQYGNYSYEGYLIDEETGKKKENIKQSTIASSTGNIYGVYDLAGGRKEAVMGFSVDVNGSMPASTIHYLSNTSSYYYDTYSYGSSSNTKYAYYRSILGDATGEVVLSESMDNGLWYNHYNQFLNMNLEFFVRGGDASKLENAGLFSFDAVSSYSDEGYGYRIALS